MPAANRRPRAQRLTAYERHLVARYLRSAFRRADFGGHWEPVADWIRDRDNRDALGAQTT